MPTFKYAKLVRDNIPGWHRENGHTINGRRLTGNDLLEALIAKLHEEADEVSGAMSRDDLIEEIGDVQQIINDILSSQNIAHSEIEQSIQKKTGRKGGFLQGEYIESVTIPNENDEWAQYCRRAPEKYPEIR
ncbi:MAG TPA: nucleoside triphosphate pyrophosphohydrolase [Patescibacteria group bacterium]|nr:nucleoside triphosphate pyrophosphohydrolase [Patescibacteria group bacterium]